MQQYKDRNSDKTTSSFISVGISTAGHIWSFVMKLLSHLWINYTKVWRFCLENWILRAIELLVFLTNTLSTAGYNILFLFRGKKLWSISIFF